MNPGLARPFEGVDTVLFAHAHPDDETLSSGTLMAELADSGIRVELVTATRGERGEIAVGSSARLLDADELAAHREAELAAALQVLGTTAHTWLGEPPARAAGRKPRRYHDSGMRWVRPGLAGPAPDLSRDALCAAPLDEVTSDVSALLDAWRPQLVVSYDAGGGYGHPDHVRIREAALQAARERRIPFAELTREQAHDVSWFDGRHRLAQVTNALIHHASQVTVDGDHVVHSGGQREPIMTSVGLRFVT